MSLLTGLLPVDKPVGPTSHDIVARARRALGIRRVGHTGTLDPFASGLLILCLGAATRLAEYLVPLPKIYTATLRLGVVTATDDRDGEVMRSTDTWRDVTTEQVSRAFARQRGDILQLPPRYSAKKVAGKPMYAIAREGGAVVPKAVPVTIHAIRMTRFAAPDVDFEVECSSGTYIRAIARDVGEDLDVGAHLVALRRTRIGPHTVEAALAVSQLERREAVDRAIISPTDALRHLPRLTLEPRQEAVVRHGGGLAVATPFAAEGPIALLAANGALLAVAERDGDRLRPKKVFV